MVQVVGGPNLIQQLLATGLVDELRVDVMPVVLGGGTPLFGKLEDQLLLEKQGVQEIGDRVSLSFRVLRG